MPRRRRGWPSRSRDIPAPGDPAKAPTVGTDLLTLVHTYAHRFIRQMAAFAGIDRDALSEYLMPRHLGFFVYAAARGDFVLGGLQAVFETDIHQLRAPRQRVPVPARPGLQPRGRGVQRLPPRRRTVVSCLQHYARPARPLRLRRFLGCTGRWIAGWPQSTLLVSGQCGSAIRDAQAKRVMDRSHSG